jgi:eukaryotic-like serine/threonine-protein kinase
VVGEVIDERYELEELVGSGGMSSVYRAHDALLERHVAIKILHEHVGRDAEQVERFKREARAVAQLSHPNIVTVIDRGERQGRQFIVFEYVEGENLKQLVVRSGALPVRRALELAIEVARGLAYAHAHGLVHRDVKPQNVLVPDGGQAKVTDFGIVQTIDVEGLTKSGSVIGTSHYIAPEQAQGGTVDERTDVYALGAVLYELLTGGVPYDGDNFVSVALKHVNDVVPGAGEHRPELSPRLDAAVRRAMAKDPDDRFESMDDFESELRACLMELGPDFERDATLVVPSALRAPAARPADEAPKRHRSRRRLVLWLVLALVAVAIAAGALALVHYGVPDFGDSTGSKGGAGGSPPPPSELHPVHLRASGTYDPPPGDGHENDDAVPNATDGNQSTYWSTEGYDQGLAAIGKKGVGLVLAAPADTEVATVTISSDTPGFSAEIEKGSSAGGPFEKVSDSQTVGSRTTFQLNSGTKAPYLVIWITSLAHPDRFRAHVNEVTAQAR